MKSIYNLVLFKREENQITFTKYNGEFNNKTQKIINQIRKNEGITVVIGYEYEKLNSLSFDRQCVVPMERAKKYRHIQEIPCLVGQIVVMSLLKYISSMAGF